MADACLEVTDAHGRRLVPISRNPFELGRREGNDLKLAGAEVSRDHAQIAIDGPRFKLLDRNSRYGTFVNGEQVTERILVHGDRIRLGRNGGAEMVFLLVDPPPSVDRTTGTAVSEFRQMVALLEGLRARGKGGVLDDVLSLVLDSAIEVSGAERGFIMLATGSADLQFTMARRRGPMTLSEEPVAISQKIPEEVFRTGEPKFVKDLHELDHADQHTRTLALGIRNVACVPLRLVRYVDKAENLGEERRIGVLYLDSKETGSLRPDSIRAALEALAAEAAVAIENARLYRQSLEKERLEHEMRIAAEIQQALLPKAAPTGACFRAAAASLPCRSIGGDFYDYADMVDGSLVFTLGDVAGKGPPAALLSAMMQGIFAAQATASEGPAATVARMNLALHRRRIESRFVTIMYGVLAADGRMAYCNAGHNPPLVIGSSGVRRLERGGTIVGLFEAATYEEETVQLTSGDWLVIFSDGISEATSASGDEYGEARIIECIQRNAALDPSRLLDALFKDVREFAQGEPQGDDITAMVIRYSAP
jgi:serine phosphatase RsbU (regulator of sigma subunit)